MNDKEYRKGQHKLIMIMCIFVFLLFLGYTIIWEINYFSKYGNFKRAKCRVDEHIEIDGKMYDVFTFETDKKEFIQKISTFESKYDVGDKFYIYYDKNCETEIIYKADSRKVLLPVITVVFGIVTGGVITLYILTYKKNKVRN